MVAAVNTFHVLGLFLILGLVQSQAATVNYTFVVREANYTRLCSTKSILTVNGSFPGPTIYAHTGDTIIVKVINQGDHNITIHWHGVKQPRYPWSDGPEFITQCPIQPGANFTQKVLLSDEVGTLWWHAHSDWTRATVHGLIALSPKKGTKLPFPKPYAEVPIILGDWWKSDIFTVMDDFLINGGDPALSDALLINGQPGDLYPCSSLETTKINVERGKTYLLRMVNAAMNNLMFFGIANHTLTVVAADGAYTKQVSSGYVVISPGQTFDLLLETSQTRGRFYMAAKFYNGQPALVFDNTTTTGILDYDYRLDYIPTVPPFFPSLPAFDNTMAAFNFTQTLKSLAPVDPSIKQNKTKSQFFFTLSINTLPCAANDTCEGPGGRRFAASINNITLQFPRISILEAYYYRTKGVYNDEFPDDPPLYFNFTASGLNQTLQTPTHGTEVSLLKFNETVELVFQGTNLVAGVDHPMHLHGYSFYVVGRGFGNYNRTRDSPNYNLVDPPLMQTIAVPQNGWTAIRFRANNPGVWFMHCHFERHVSWGMGMTFIVANGKKKSQKMLRPPSDMPPC